MTETLQRPRRRRGRIAAAALGLSAALAAQAAPAGAETMHFSFKGQTIEARFYTQQGCTATQAYVHAVDGRVKVGPGRPDAQSTVFVTVTRVDICTQQPLGFSLGFRENVGDALAVDRLDGATLATTVPMTDMATGATSTMDVQLHWAGIGEPFTAREHVMVDYPGARVISRANGTTRAADVAGVLSDGTVDYTAGAWAWGTLSSVHAGDVIILH